MDRNSPSIVNESEEVLDAMYEEVVNGGLKETDARETDVRETDGEVHNDDNFDDSKDDNKNPNKHPQKNHNKHPNNLLKQLHKHPSCQLMEGQTSNQLIWNLK